MQKDVKGYAGNYYNGYIWKMGMGKGLNGIYFLFKCLYCQTFSVISNINTMINLKFDYGDRPPGSNVWFLHVLDVKNLGNYSTSLSQLPYKIRVIVFTSRLFCTVLRKVPETQEVLNICYINISMYII